MIALNLVGCFHFLLIVTQATIKSVLCRMNFNVLKLFIFLATWRCLYNEVVDTVAVVDFHQNTADSSRDTHLPIFSSMLHNVNLIWVQGWKQGVRDDCC